VAPLVGRKQIVPVQPREPPFDAFGQVNAAYASTPTADVQKNRPEPPRNTVLDSSIVVTVN
jgi:hypothetical protein